MFSYRSAPKNFIKFYSTVTCNRSHLVACIQSFQNQNVICHHQKYADMYVVPYRCLTRSIVRLDNAAAATTKSTQNQPPNIGDFDTLTEYQAYDMIHKLSEKDRVSLSKALSKFDSEKTKSKFQGN